jgi:hypothetical protein
VLECYRHFEVSIITFGVKKLTIWSLIIDNYEVVIKEKIVKSIGLMFVRTTKKISKFNWMVFSTVFSQSHLNC